AWSEHHQSRPPETVQSVLCHCFLLFRTFHQGTHDLISLALVKRFFLADTYHCSCIRPVRSSAQRNLIHDRSTVNQPSNCAHIGPGQCGVIENRRVFCFPGVHIIDTFLAGSTQCFH